MNKLTFHSQCLNDAKVNGPIWKGVDLYSNASPVEISYLKTISKRIWKSQGEKFYRCSLPYEKILFESQWFSFPKTFFKSDFLDVINPDNFRWERNYGYKYQDQELWIKLCWICDELLTDGNLRTELGAHINPFIEPSLLNLSEGDYPIVIHPGGTRQTAIMLFTPPKIKAFFFNTLGKSNMEGFEDIEELNVWDLESTHQTILCPDHGTFIPHIMYKHQASSSIIPGKITYFKRIKNNLKELNLISNKDFPSKHLLPNNVNGNLKFYLEIKKGWLNPMDTLRVLILICLGRELVTDAFSLKLRGKV